MEISSKGTTVFVEPSSISRFTSELSILKAEEAVEEYRILALITELIHEKLKGIKINIEIISEYDMILAKANIVKK